MVYHTEIQCFVILPHILLRYQLLRPIFPAQGRLLNLAGRVARYFGKDNFLRPLIARKLLAERLNFFFAAFHSFFDSDNGACNLAQPFIWQANHSYILDFLMCA